MFLVIQGKRYPLDDALARPSLNDLMALHAAIGMGRKTLGERLARIDALPGGYRDVMALSEEPELMQAMRAVVWLARRTAGEALTIDEANDFPASELLLESDAPPVPEVEPDPTPASPDSGPGDAPARKTKARSTSRTSGPK